MVGHLERRSQRPKLSTGYDPDDLEWLSRKAAEKNISVAETIRRCVKFARKSVADRAA